MFSHIKRTRKNDLAVKKVNFNPRSSFMVILVYQMLHTKFQALWSLDSGDDLNCIVIPGTKIKEIVLRTTICH